MDCRAVNVVVVVKAQTSISARDIRSLTDSILGNTRVSRSGPRGFPQLVSLFHLLQRATYSVLAIIVG